MDFVKAAQKFHFLALEGGENKTKFARLAFDNARKVSRKSLSATEFQRAKRMLPKGLLKPLLRGGDSMTIRGPWKTWNPSLTSPEDVIQEANELLDAMSNENKILVQREKALKKKLKKIPQCDDAKIQQLQTELTPRSRFLQASTIYTTCIDHEWRRRKQRCNWWTL